MQGKTTNRTSRGNPAYPNYFADPFVFRHADRYFAIGTGPVHHANTSGRIFPMLVSDDFVTWIPIEGALVPPPSVSGSHFWAPEIAHKDGSFYLYYSVGNEDVNHQLRVAVSDSPMGPFVDVGAPLLDPASCPFAIDPSPFRDDDGAWYLYYARDLLDGERPGTSLVVTALSDMVRVSSDFEVVARASQDWQRFAANRPIYGSSYDWHTLEGPCVVKHDQRYYCFYSGGNWQNATYGVDFVSSNSPVGLFACDNPDPGPRVLKTVPGSVIGPGHNSVVVGPDGRTSFIAYHAWDSDGVARRFCLDVLLWTEDGPRCQGPTWEQKTVDG